MADKTVLLATKITGDGSDANRAFDSTADSASKASSKMQKAGSVAGKVLAVGLVAAGAAALAATNKAADLAETQSKVNVIFGEQGAAALDKFAGAAATKLGQSKQSALDAAATFGQFGKMAGLSGGKLVGFSTKFTRLASDMASFNNTSPEEAIEAIGAALRGESEPIRKYGVLLDDATLRQEAMRLGIIKTTSQALTPQQKVLAAQAAIFKQTKDQQGDFARTSDSVANKQRILSAQFENLQAKIGAGLIPVMSKAIDIGLKIVGWIERNQTTAAVLATTLGVLTAAVWITSKAIAAWSTITKIATGVQAAFNFVMAANPVVLVVAAIVALGVALVVAYKKSETFRKIVDTVFGFIVGAAKGVINFFREHWKTVLLVLLTGPVGLAYIAIKKHGGKIKDFFFGLVDRVTGFVKDHWKKGLFLLLTGPFGLAYPWIKGKAGDIGRWLLDWLGRVGGWFRDLPGKIGSALRSLPGKLRSAAADGIRWFMDQLRGSPIIGWFRDLPGKIKDVLGDLGHLLWDVGSDIVNGLWEGMKSKWEDAKDWVGNIDDEIKDLKGPPSYDKVMLKPTGEWIVDGLMAGMDARRGKLRNQLRKLTDEIRTGVGAATAEPIRLATPRFAGAGAGSSAAATNVAYITVTGAVDAMSTARQIRDLLNRQSSWRGQLVRT